MQSGSDWSHLGALVHPVHNSHCVRPHLQALGIVKGTLLEVAGRQ